MQKKFVELSKQWFFFFWNLRELLWKRSSTKMLKYRNIKAPARILLFLGMFHIQSQMATSDDTHNQPATQHQIHLCNYNLLPLLLLISFVFAVSISRYTLFLTWILWHGRFVFVTNKSRLTPFIQRILHMLSCICLPLFLK